MIYILVIIGLALIFVSFKFGKSVSVNNEFSELVQQNINSKDIETIVIALKDFSDRIDNIEASLVLLQDSINSNNINSEVIDFEEAIVVSDDDAINNKRTKTEIDHQKNQINSINDAIFELYDEGTPIEDISSITKVGKGEILLRLGLRKEKK